MTICVCVYVRVCEKRFVSACKYTCFYFIISTPTTHICFYFIISIPTTHTHTHTHHTHLNFTLFLLGQLHGRLNAHDAKIYPSPLGRCQRCFLAVGENDPELLSLGGERTDEFTRPPVCVCVLFDGDGEEGYSRVVGVCEARQKEG
jgi:hypothetical protein